MTETPANRRSWRRGARLIAVLAIGAAGIATAFAVWGAATGEERMTSTVQRGTLAIRLTVGGTLKPVVSTTYRSPLGGRETEVTFLVPEGTLVSEGDLLVRLDATALERELERAIQDVRQAQVDLQVAEIDRQEGQAAVESLSEGEAALTVEETRLRVQLAEKKVARLQAEQASLEPLLAKGFITREELKRTTDEREQAEADLAAARRRAEVLIERTHPRDRQRARLQLAQKDAQLENVKARMKAAQARVKLLRTQIEHCSQYARHPGLAVYEEVLGANPRRKIRIGDRVTESQGLVTIPELNRMVVEASVAEADVHRVRPGQIATIVLEAFRDRVYTGKVTRVGTLAQATADRPLEHKRFDVSVELDRPDETLRPEMTARVDVRIGERPGVLLVPLSAIFDHEGQRVAMVVKRLGVEARAVRLGESGDTHVEVVSGLKEGELVELSDRNSLPRAVAPAATMSPGTVGSGGTLGPR